LRYFTPVYAQQLLHFVAFVQMPPMPAKRSRRRRQPANAEKASSTTKMVLFNRPTTVHKFVRYMADATLTAPAVDGGASYSVTLGAVLDSSEFTNLFDQFRITILEFTWTWAPYVAAVHASNFPTIYLAADFDGSTAPAVIADIQTRGSCKQIDMSDANRSMTVVVKNPGVLLTAASGSGRVERSPWLDVALTSESHYGIVAWYKNYNTIALSGVLTLSRRLHFELRESR